MTLCEVCLGWKGAIVQDGTTILRNAGKMAAAKIGLGKRGDLMDAHALSGTFTCTVEGQGVLVPEPAIETMLAVLNSSVFSSLISLYCGQHKYPGYVAQFPFPAERLAPVGHEVRELLRLLIVAEASSETSPTFLNTHLGEEEAQTLCKQACSLAESIDGAVISAYGLQPQDVRWLKECRAATRESFTDRFSRLGIGYGSFHQIWVKIYISKTSKY